MSSATKKLLLLQAPPGGDQKKPDEQDYHIMDLRHKMNTPDVPAGSIRNLVVPIPELYHVWG